MAANPYRAALRQAQRDNRYLTKLFDSYIGNGDHPRGKVLSAYRHARAQVAAIAATAAPATARYQVNEILRVLGNELRSIGLEALGSAATRGQESARKQLSAYMADGAVVQVAAEDVNVLAQDLVGPENEKILKENITLYREHYIYLKRGSVDRRGSNRPQGGGVVPGTTIPVSSSFTGRELFR